MFNLQLTEEEIKRGSLVDPDWYLIEIKKAKEETSKKGNSTNLVLDFSVVTDSKGGTKFASLPVRHWINEQAAWAAIDFLAALGLEIKATSYSLDPEALVGKRVMGFIRPTPNPTDPSGKMVNAISDFKKAAQED